MCFFLPQILLKRSVVALNMLGLGVFGIDMAISIHTDELLFKEYIFVWVTLYGSLFELTIDPIKITFLLSRDESIVVVVNL